MIGHSTQPQHALRRDEFRITQMAARAPLDQFRQLLKDVLRTWSRRKGTGWNCSHSVGDNWTGSGSCTWNSTARCHDLNFLEEIVQSNGRHLKPNSLEDKRPQNLSALAREPLEPKWIRIYVCIIISIYIYIYVYVHSCVPSWAERIGDVASRWPLGRSKLPAKHAQCQNWSHKC